MTIDKFAVTLHTQTRINIKKYKYEKNSFFDTFYVLHIAFKGSKHLHRL